MSAARTLRTLLALALAGLCWWVGARVPAVDPLQDRACGDCHVTSGQVEAATAGVLQGSQERLCAQCHPRAGTASHPTGVKPSMDTGADYPVDWKGELTCSSCHQVHGATHGLLRGAKRRREFCIACHKQAFFDRMADGGQSLVVSGHLDAAGDAVDALLDPFTAQCMACHGESGDRRVQVAGGNTSRHASSGVSHPVGVSYEKARGYGGYRARAALDPAIELPGGLVSCISCHRGYSRNHGAVRTTQRGGLCLECHDL